MSTASPPLPQIVAHRGNAAEFPENTLPALRSALQLGVRHVEFDVQLSADHVPFLLHDSSLARTAGIDRDALDMAWADLSGVTVNETTRFGDRFRDVGIPSLEQAVELLGDFPAATVFVELKRSSLRRFGHEPVVRRVADALAPIADRAVVISFDLAAVHLARTSANLRIGWVLSDLNSLTALKCEAIKPEYLFCDHGLLAARDRLWRGPWDWVVYEVTTRMLALDLSARGARFVETMQVRAMLRELRPFSS